MREGDDTFADTNPVTPDEERRLRILTVIELALLELDAADKREPFLSDDERHARDMLARRVEKHMMPKTYVDVCRRCDRLMQLADLMHAMVSVPLPLDRKMPDGTA